MKIKKLENKDSESIRVVYIESLLMPNGELYSGGNPLGYVPSRIKPEYIFVEDKKRVNK